MGRPHVIGLGLCVVDHSYLVEELDERSERVRYLARNADVGGMVTTALAQAARLGCRASLLSMVGADADAGFVRRRLREVGVGTRGLIRNDATQTTVSVVRVRRRDGERRFLVPDRRALERRARSFDVSGIGARSVLLVDGHFPSQARRALRRARAVGAPTVGDFSEPRPEFLELLPAVTHPVVPESFVRAFAPGGTRAALQRLHEEYGGSPVVTLGRRGGLYWDAGRIRRFASPEVEVKDTTGAGDAFHGAFCAGLAYGLPLSEVVLRAARAGALACTAFGGLGRLATRREWENARKAAGRP